MHAADGQYRDDTIAASEMAAIGGSARYRRAGSLEGSDALGSEDGRMREHGRKGGYTFPPRVHTSPRVRRGADSLVVPGSRYDARADRPCERRGRRQ